MQIQQLWCGGQRSSGMFPFCSKKASQSQSQVNYPFNIGSTGFEFGSISRLCSYAVCIGCKAFDHDSGHTLSFTLMNFIYSHALVQLF